ncbi:MAG: L-rhamnose isomerase [Clostridiales bacterium]|jgi:L-rhamnose isomerase|nr:L-rhamnose isomerase [Clostridiales bacterium]
MSKSYDIAREVYASYEIDTEKALKQMDEIPVSINCWQLDDLTGFEDFNAVPGGGLAATGAAPGKPASVEAYFKDMNKMLALVPGAKKLALHSIYALTEGRRIPRNRLEPEHFTGWAEYAKEKGIGLDFNPTYFSHPRAASGWTLSSPDASVRAFWIEHGVRCRRIGQYLGSELNMPCVTNHWIPDGSKDTRADTLGPRERLRASLDSIFAAPADGTPNGEPRPESPKNIDSLESKLFGLGCESYTTGSHEFYSNYVATTGKAILCMDTGHYHPTETVSSKLSSYYAFGQRIMLHISRPVRWDSDHVPVMSDEVAAIMQEIKRCDAFGRTFIGTDFFDGSINRIAASVIGARTVKAAVLHALLEPTPLLRKAEEEDNPTKRLVLLEEFKTLPAGLVFAEYCERHGVRAHGWLEEI